MNNYVLLGSRDKKKKKKESKKLQGQDLPTEFCQWFYRIVKKFKKKYNDIGGAMNMES